MHGSQHDIDLRHLCRLCMNIERIETALVDIESAMHSYVAIAKLPLSPDSLRTTPEIVCSPRIMIRAKRLRFAAVNARVI